MCPLGGSLFGGSGPPWTTHEMVAHCLVIESSAGLVLVDTGFGTDDVKHPKRLGQPFRAATRPRVSLEDTALSRIAALGLDPADVRHIVLTHLDVDHAGGLGDFPDAEVHVHRDEHAIAMNPPLRQSPRYIQPQWEHGPRWELYAPGGDEWFGLESVRVVPGTDEEVLLIPTAGHSRGHSAVAVRHDGRWFLHCGDAYFHHAEVETPPSCPRGLHVFQNLTAYDHKARLANQERLRELRRAHGAEVDLFCSHDPHDLARFNGRSGGGESEGASADARA